MACHSLTASTYGDEHARGYRGGVSLIGKHADVKALPEEFEMRHGRRDLSKNVSHLKGAAGPATARI
jgi:hypothetical protein